MKNILKTTKEKTYTASEFGSILERIDTNVQILAEGHSALVDGQDEIKKTLVGIDQRLGGVEIRLGGVEGRLELVETKIDRLQDDIVEVKFDLKRKVDAEQFEKLEKRVVKLEKHSYSH